MLNEDKKIIVKRVIVELAIFALLLASDLVSKQIVLNDLGLESYTQYVIVDGLFAIYPCTNDGASFSIFAGKTGFLIALTAILLVAICVLMIYNIIKKPRTSWLFRWSMLLIVAGGAGNLYDRIFCDGEVRDFIQYMFLDKIWQPLFDSNFGVGNIADIYLVLGVFMVCVYIVFEYKEGDLGIFKPKQPKDLRPDEVPVEDAVQRNERETAEDSTPHEEGQTLSEENAAVSENSQTGTSDADVAAEKQIAADIVSKSKRGKKSADAE